MAQLSSFRICITKSLRCPMCYVKHCFVFFLKHLCRVFLKKWFWPTLDWWIPWFHCRQTLVRSRGRVWGPPLWDNWLLQIGGGAVKGGGTPAQFPRKHRQSFSFSKCENSYKKHPWSSNSQPFGCKVSTCFGHDFKPLRKPSSSMFCYSGILGNISVKANNLHPFPFFNNYILAHKF